MTKNSIDSNIPIELSKGGTNATSFSTSDGVVKYDGTSLITSTTYKISSTNQITNSAQPCFLATTTTGTDVTGDGTAFTIVFGTEIFDNGANYDTGTGIFTAPVTGIYILAGSINVQDLTSSTTLWTNDIVTSNRTYRSNYSNPWAIAYSTNTTQEFGTLADMDAGDTAYVVLTVSNGTKVVDIGTTYDNTTRFLGHLLA